MPDYDIAGLNRQLSYFKPDGNLSQLVHTISGLSGSRAANDREFILKLPRGILITKVVLNIRTGTGGTGTIDIGTVQKGNQTGDLDWTDDPDFFFDGIAQQTAANHNSQALRRPMLRIDREDVFMTITWNGNVTSANLDNLVADIYLEYIVEGNE